MKIGYLTRCNPYPSEGLRGWYHLDPFMKLLKSEGHELISLKEVVDLDKIMPDLSHFSFGSDYSEIDALIIDTVRMEIGFELEKVKEFIEKGTPTLIYDIDGIFDENPIINVKDKEFELLTYLQSYNNEKGNVTIAYPFKHYTSFKLSFYRKVRIPFVVDYNHLKTPSFFTGTKSTHYIGNNFKRNKLIKLFEAIKQNESTKNIFIEVTGAGWSDTPEIDFYNGSQRYTEEEYEMIYGESFFAIFTLPCNNFIGIIPYRIREYIREGVPFFTLNGDSKRKIYITEEAMEGKKLSPLFECFLKYTDDEKCYSDLVKAQRELLKEEFDMNNYLTIFYNSIGLARSSK